MLRSTQKPVFFLTLAFSLASAGVFFAIPGVLELKGWPYAVGYWSWLLPAFWVLSLAVSRADSLLSKHSAYCRGVALMALVSYLVMGVHICLFGERVSGSSWWMWPLAPVVVLAYGAPLILPWILLTGLGYGCLLSRLTRRLA